jgi:hypothetical protein
MSLSPSVFRRAAIGIATAAIFAGSSARAGDFTHDQCRLISAVAADVMKALGPSSLSVEFRQSLIKFIVPNGKQLTCDGTKEIVTPTGADIDAFNTMRVILLAPPSRISLEQAGLRSVPRASASAGGAPTIN